jgi:hypothetical protein
MLAADHVIFATGYRADLARVPYLSGVVDQLSIIDGFPELSEGFETSLNGLYITGSRPPATSVPSTGSPQAAHPRPASPSPR